MFKYDKEQHPNRCTCFLLWIHQKWSINYIITFSVNICNRPTVYWFILNFEVNLFSQSNILLPFFFQAAAAGACRTATRLLISTCRCLWAATKSKSSQPRHLSSRKEQIPTTQKPQKLCRCHFIALTTSESSDQGTCPQVQQQTKHFS